MASFFLVIEGLDGTGKSELSLRLAQVLGMTMGENVKLTFEPHDPSCGGLFIRQVLMRKIKKVSTRTLALAFATNRMDHCEREIGPFLDGGEQRILICDRYYLSSLAYQVLQENELEEVFDLNREARKPDLTLFLNARNEICFERMKRRQEEKELFERNLNMTRQRYKEAIRFLREKESHEIIEIDANKDINEVLIDVLRILLEIGPKWLRIQPVLSANLLPSVFTLNGDRKTTVESIANRSSRLWNQGAFHTEKDLVECLVSIAESIRSEVNKLSYNELGSLFLDILSRGGYKVGEKIPWTELDAFQLSYSLPWGIEQKGVALFLGEAQRYELVLKRATAIKNMSDFMFTFQPSRWSAEDQYYERDIIDYGNANTSLSPNTRLFGKGDVASVVTNEAYKLLHEEHFQTFSFRTDLAYVLQEYLNDELMP